MTYLDQWHEKTVPYIIDMTAQSQTNKVAPRWWQARQFIIHCPLECDTDISCKLKSDFHVIGLYKFEAFRFKRIFLKKLLISLTAKDNLQQCDSNLI